ncbi:hypothetical protein G7Y89_g8876 [Cudoniella acicularis]|uniref:Uncharacterized protein n=1 Tax=Cudoniella acicularis TaxID=354080 RepID=A0A8H4RJH7_9HELO|nr:hypothetical protein G7Y89_g8876 [Cudoniella acicularis]
MSSTTSIDLPPLQNPKPVPNSRTAPPERKARQNPGFSFITIGDPSEAKSRARKKAVRSHVAYLQHFNEYKEWTQQRKMASRTQVEVKKSRQEIIIETEDINIFRSDGECNCGETASSNPCPHVKSGTVIKRASYTSTPMMISSMFSMDRVSSGLRVDPFKTYPVPFESFMPQIVDHYLVQMAVDIPELDVGTPGLLRSAWFPFAMSEPAVFLVILLLAASNYVSVRGESSDIPNLLLLKQKAIRCINEALRDPRRAKTCQLVGAVAKMASYEAMYGTYESYSIHMQGLTKMLELKGGFENLSLNGLLSRICLWIDNNSAFLHNSPNRFFEISIADPNPGHFIDEQTILITLDQDMHEVHPAAAYHTNLKFDHNLSPHHRPAKWGPPTKRDGNVPLKVTNNCAEKIWPGIGTQAGTGPGQGGFELDSGDSQTLMVSGDWQGRVWGRTNCSFNVDGTGASNLNGNNGGGAACDSGDCGGVLDCVITGVTPVTLAEFDLVGGVGNKHTFYDISLVDGYNLPLGIVYIPGDNPKLQTIPPNLTNAACIGTAGFLDPPAPSSTTDDGVNSSYPIPWEPKQDNSAVASWCPWDLLAMQPTKPGDGVYPYPDSNIERPIFDPCFSACSKTNAPSDCCTGAYSDRSKCQPNMYATAAKAVCPDAYSYAFDDDTSTFIIPTGGGWEVVFCPAGRSTNILATFMQQLQDLGGAGAATKAIKEDCQNMTIILEAAKRSGGERSRGELGVGEMGSMSLGALVVVVAWAVLW